MKTKFTLLSIFIVTFLFSQNNYVHQVLLLNEGSYDYTNNEIISPVTVGVYNPQLNEYNTILEINDARFASDLIIADSFFYVAADNKIFKYDLNTFEQISTVDFQGVRRLAIYDDYIFASRGDYDNLTFSPIVFDSYLDVFSKETLDHLFSFGVDEGPNWSTENIIINNDKLYVTINNAYEWGNYKGIIGIVDLSTMTYTDELDLGEDGKNPINLMLKDNTLYTVNNQNWDGSSVSIIDLDNNEPQTMNLADVSAGCGVSILRGSKLNYQKSGDNLMYIFNVDTQTQGGVESQLNDNFYAVAQDEINNYLYASSSDFVSNSQVSIYNSENIVVNSFIADVNTRNIVFDIRNDNSSNIKEYEFLNNDVMYLDLLGRSVKKNTKLSLQIIESKIQSKFIFN